jgi:hypothetical protein
MKHALLPLAALMVLAGAAPGANDDPLPGRDGSYRFEALSIEGTVWQGRLIPEAEMLVRFERGGVLWYRYINTNGPGSRVGSWKQMGNTVTLETNHKYAEYRAILRGDQMIGEAHNIRPFEWKWEMKRQPASAAPKDDNVQKEAEK